MENDQPQSIQIVQNYVNILVVSTDLSLPKAVQAACQTVANENADKNYRVFPGINKEKWLEALEKYTFHSVLIEEDSLIDTTAEMFLSIFRDCMKKRPENTNTPIILVTSKLDADYFRRMVRVGYADVVVKPLDRSIFLQKMNLYNPAIPFLRESLLFNMDFKKEVDVTFNFECASLSECGMKVMSERPVDRGLVVGLSASFFDVTFSAVVLDCMKLGDKYKIEFMFVGLTPSETQAVRKLIRSEYADEKQSA